MIGGVFAVLDESHLAGFDELEAIAISLPRASYFSTDMGEKFCRVPQPIS